MASILLELTFKAGKKGQEEEKSIIIKMAWNKEATDTGTWFKDPPSGYVGRKGGGFFGSSSVVTVLLEEWSSTQMSVPVVNLWGFPRNAAHVKKGLKGKGEILQSNFPVAGRSCTWATY